MFKPRRSSNLVLMTDDKRSTRLGKSNDYVKGGKERGKGKWKDVNATKPYAGEGGMKKLLARRKLELEEAEEEAEEEQEDARDRDDDDEGEDEDAMDDDQPPRRHHKKDTQEHQPTPTLPAPVPPPPPPQTTDWFPPSSSSSTSSRSSLRVGRTKTSRNHIARPKNKKFSAAFIDDEEGADADDSMDGGFGEEGEKEKEKKDLEDAVLRAPVFEIPKGFSFAKEVSFRTVLRLLKGVLY